MSDYKEASPAKIKSKISSSLVLKLNAGMLWRLISGFFSINVLIIFISFFIISWKVEQGIHTLISIPGLIPNNGQHIDYNIDHYEIHKIKEFSSSKGFSLFDTAQKMFPLKIKNAKRNIKIDSSKKDPIKNEMKTLEKLDLIKYSIETNINGSFYEITCSLGPELRLFLLLFLIISSYELLIIIGNLKKGARRIRNTLKPLSDLAETAKSLHAEVSAAGLRSEGRYIQDLAGVISGIDANKLDSRIAVDSSQNELKDLSFAINDMLNRINDSYQSQIRFVSDASHELRTPISVIQGYANLLDRWGKNDEKTMQESIDAIKGEAESMQELVEQLLFLARGDNETIQFHMEQVELCEIMDVVIKETQMIDSNHDFEVNLDRPAYISADKQLIKQVIRILVDNSIKYTPHGEKIILKIANQDHFVHITVQDSGIGIAPENLAHIFDRFYRSDESRARKTGGSGLGLSIAKWIIEQHNGHFEILSRLNMGTRTTILIPKLSASERRKM